MLFLLPQRVEAEGAFEGVFTPSPSSPESFVFIFEHEKSRLKRNLLLCNLFAASIIPQMPPAPH